MNKTSVAQSSNTTNFLPPARGILQRKCACGTHTMGGGQCAECQKRQVNGKLLQTKLAISEPGDAYEQEADRVADQVMRMSPADISKRQNGSRTQPLVQRQASGGALELVEAPPLVYEVLNAPGTPLDSSTRAFFEPRFGHDFSQVRVHTDTKASASAESVNALAYTVGNDIVFRTGWHEPSTTTGRHLLAHELAHTVQQSADNSATPTAFSIGALHDPAEAEVSAVDELLSVDSTDNSNVAVALSNVVPTLAKVDCTTLTYKTCKPYSCGYGRSGVCGWGGIANGCRCMGATRPSSRRVLEVLLIIGISITLLATVIAALLDPEPVTKLGLAGLSAAQIALLLTMLGYEDSSASASEGTASIGSGGDASAVNPQNVA